MIPGGAGLLIEFGNGQAGGGFLSGIPTLNGNRAAGTIDINHTGDQTLIAATTDTLTLANGNITRDFSSTGSQTIGSRIALGSSGEWSIFGDGGLIINNLILGTDTLTKTGTGTLFLGAANPFSGTFDISLGTVILAHANALQNAIVNIDYDDALDITTNTLDANLGALSGTAALNIGAQTLTFGGNNQDTTYSGALTGSGDINKIGTGSFTFGGPGAGPTGTANINNGKIVLLSARALFDSTVSININDGLDVTTNATDADLGALTGTGDLNIGAQTVVVGYNDTSTTYDGVLDGTGVFQKTGSGTLTVTSAFKFAGNAIAAEGKLLLANADALQNATVVIQNDNILDITTNTLDANLGALTGSGALDIGAQTLTVGSNDASTTFTDGGGGGLQGTGTLVKTGTGTLELAGSHSSFNGAITVAGGALAMNAVDMQVATLDVQPGNTLAMNTGANLRYQADLTLDAATLDIDAATFDMSGIDGDIPTEGKNLTVNGATAAVDITGTALVDLDGGDKTVNPGTGAIAGSLVVNDGSFTLGPDAEIRARGGQADGQAETPRPLRLGHVLRRYGRHPGHHDLSRTQWKRREHPWPRPRRTTRRRRRLVYRRRHGRRHHHRRFVDQWRQRRRCR